jgi:hypothetical protein
MSKANLWKAVVLLGTCVWLGVKNGIRHGWLAGHTHWLTHRRGIYND